ncbi:MAG: dihydrolipoamide acetyltransferase family protein [Bacteroidota bacterium]|jgi:2-oxoglutarate dehydrogenase complex dihydrolipoamide succinyltransferase (E2) component
MQVEIIMPKMGESIQEGTIIRWLKSPGEKIEKDETLLEISTDKVDSEIPSPVSGIVAKIFAKEQDTVLVGTIIAYIETDSSVKIETYQDVTTETTAKKSQEGTGVPQNYQLSTVQDREQKRNAQRFYSPLVKMIAKREGLAQRDLEKIKGSGSNGRVTKDDVFTYLEQRERTTSTLYSNESAFRIRSVDILELSKKYPSPKYRIVKMDNIQKKMAEHMVRSVNTSPHVTVVDEVDMTEIVNFRLSILEQFEKQQGFKLTYTPFFAYAVVSTLKEFPLVNSSVEGDTIIYKNFINLGMAVASPNGLIVPVVRNTEEKNFVDMARALTDITLRARTKKLTPDDIVDGTFSITNYGIFGSIIGTPIINQPQSAIIGIGSIKKRAQVVTDDSGKDSIGIRSMVYLTQTFDHRIIDGATGGQFLSRVKWQLEHFDFQSVK